MILIYIPARGGSKGIPGKNMHPFLGKPLIYQTLKIAKQLEDCYQGEVINFLSTDEDDIIAYSRDFGFDCDYKRPDKLASDDATIVDGIYHAMDWLKKNNKQEVSHVLVLQPTSPLRELAHAKQFIKHYFDNQLNSAFSVIPMRQHPIECISISSDSWDYLKTPIKRINQRQKYPQSDHFIDGSYYMCSIQFLKSNNCLVKKGYSVPFIINDKFQIDIDVYEDLVMAEGVYKVRNQ